MRSISAGGKRTLLVALLANVGTALAKLVAAWFTGSSAMWAEAFHAFADSGNEILLLIAQRRSGRPPDDGIRSGTAARRISGRSWRRSACSCSALCFPSVRAR